MSRINKLRFMSLDPSTTLADFTHAAVRRRSIFGSAGIAEAAEL